LLLGERGNDELHGGDGNDHLSGGHQDRAADKAFGDAGNDQYAWRPGDGNDEFHGGGGADMVYVYVPDLTLAEWMSP
jgi:Ca2+-binding RTX toxin-like protein